MIRIKNGKLWIRSLRGYESETQAIHVAKQRWKAGHMVDYEKRGGLWYVWRNL